MDPIGEKLLDVAKKELGYTEKSDGYTKFGNWWYENVDDDAYFKTAPWCDMFLGWAADQAGVADQAGTFASTVQHAEWFKKQDAWGRDPEPGAIVFFSWGGGDAIRDIDHVGIVEKVKGGRVHTIEANVDGVHLKRKVRDDAIIVGYGYPSKVKVVVEQPAQVAYVPKHAAPAPRAGQIGAGEAQQTTEAGDAAPAATFGPLSGPQAGALGGVLAVALVGTVALAVGKASAAKVADVAPPVRVRKRGKHHRTRPVELPAEITPAVLDAAESSTIMMPTLSAAVAAEAEDREFWGRIDTIKEDEELQFWDAMHAELTRAPGGGSDDDQTFEPFGTPAAEPVSVPEPASAPERVPAHAVPTHAVPAHAVPAGRWSGRG